MRTIFRILKEAKKYWIYIAMSMLALIGITAAQLYAPMVVRNLTSLVTSNDPDLASKAFKMALTLAGVYVIYSICSAMRSYYTHYAAWYFVSDMRTKIYDHYQKLSLRFYHDKQTGQLMSHVISDTNNLELLIAHAAPDLIFNILIFVGVAIILFVINVKLALMSLISIPFIVGGSIWFAKKVRPKFRVRQKAIGELNATLQDNLSGIKEIQVFNQQERELNNVRSASVKFADLTVHALKLSAIYHPGVQFFSNMGTVFVIGYGGYLASVGQIPLADIVAFLLYLTIFYQPVAVLGRVNEEIQDSLAGAERVFEVLDTESDVQEKSNAIKLGKVKGKIEYRDLSFSYENDVNVLNNINLTIHPGEVVALVGPTGVGKTTMISLINRFYDPSEGSVLIDNINIKDVTLKSLRDNTSTVLQDIFLFNGTIAENISYGCDNASEEDIIKAAKAAHADEFIEKMENGYNTYIGERGVKLSGGQKQRISIARAVLRDRPILILDEATAAVDVRTEKLIHEAMDKVMENRTTIIIAHRLSTIKKADKIVVLDEGYVRELGSHEELMQKGGMYFSLNNVNIG